MSPIKILVILILFLLVGASMGYYLFSTFPDLLLPKSSSEYSLVATQENEIFVTRFLFSVFIAFAFAAVPLSALIACKFSKNGHYLLMILSFMVVMIMSMLAGVLYYQSHFTEMFAALEIQEGISIRLETIPYYKIPLLSTGVTIVLALLVLGFRTAKSSG